MKLTYMAKIKVDRFKVMIEKDRNEILRSDFVNPQRLYGSIESYYQRVDDMLVEHYSKLKSISLDPSLSLKGRKGERRAAKKMLVGKLLDGNIIEGLDGMIKKINHGITNEVVNATNNFTPTDEALAFTQMVETLRWVREFRGEKLREHEADIANKRAQGINLTDVELAFNDPITQLYLDGCSDYNEKSALFVSAIRQNPFPVNIVSDDVLAEGDKRLQLCVAPESVYALNDVTFRRNSWDRLMCAALDIAKNPGIAGVTEGDMPNLSISDQQRAAAV